MADKFVKTRVQMKRGLESDWITAEANGFLPLEGEYIFYTDLNKIKVGKKDNAGNLIPLSQLAFTNANDADTLDGKHASDFVLKTDTMAPADAEKNVQSDWNVTDTSSDAYIKNKPNVIVEGDTRLTDARTPTAHNQAATTITEDTTHRFVTDTEKAAWNAKSNFSGNYDDLTGKPTIPVVNNATLTIQKNGTNITTFTANSASNATANITVPTKVSELTNDSGFKTTDNNQTVKTGNVTFGINDQVEFVAGTNVSIAGDAANKKITISTTDTTYSAAGTSLGLVKTGGDATITDGVITVNDDSHNHVISNIDGLQDALNNKLATSLKGAANGLAELDTNGKVPTSQLPSYVDDVVEGTYVSSTSFTNTNGTSIAGEAGKIYVDNITNKTYRWSGTAFIEISASLALGETSSTAYRGDRGKVAYEHSQAAHAPSNAEKNQNAFSNVAVSGQTTVAADSATDTLTLAAGNNITITTDATNDKITIAATDTVYTHPNSGVTAGTYRTVTVNAQGHVTGGSNPTTLSGHGITDAYTKTEVETKINTLISHGATDPTTETSSRYYFKI